MKNHFYTYKTTPFSIMRPGCVNLGMIRYDPENRETIEVLSPSFKVVDVGQAPRPGETIELDASEAQQLMDVLYESGVRPTLEKQGPDLRAHLADMRAIVSVKLGVKLP